MKIISYIAVVVFLLGCSSTPQAKSVSVGMPFQQVSSILKSSGAKQTQMDMLDQTETDIIKSYDLTDRNILIVEVSKLEQKVSKLEICKNADQPKSKRIWNSVQSIEFTKN